MINIRTIKKLKDNDGLTLKNGQKISYKSGWQVATAGVECDNPRDTIAAVKSYKGNCGVWLSNGIYYVDQCHREATKTKALEVGRAHNQISIYGWKTSKLAYC